MSVPHVTPRTVRSREKANFWIGRRPGGSSKYSGLPRGEIEIAHAAVGAAEQEPVAVRVVGEG